MPEIPGIQQRPTRLQTNINGVKSYVRAPEVTEELHLDGAITLRQDNLTVGMNLTKLRAEGTIFKEQCDYISAHPFGGFRTDAGQGRRMGTLVFLARSLLVKVNEDNTVTGYAGGGNQGGAATKEIEQLITSYIASCREQRDGMIMRATEIPLLSPCQVTSSEHH